MDKVHQMSRILRGSQDVCALLATYKVDAAWFNLVPAGALSTRVGTFYVGQGQNALRAFGGLFGEFWVQTHVNQLVKSLM